MTETDAADRVDLALQIKESFKTVSPFIEKHTSIVCPDCKKVCCADKHGRYDSDDMLFLKELGVDCEQQTEGFDEEGSCRFMFEAGCSLDRWIRPFRCTFFFCDDLLKSIENDNAKLYRAFIDYFQHLVSLRQELLGSDRV